jgi:hypothetical protein
VRSPTFGATAGLNNAVSAPDRCHPFGDNEYGLRFPSTSTPNGRADWSVGFSP